MAPPWYEQPVNFDDAAATAAVTELRRLARYVRALATARSDRAAEARDGWAGRFRDDFDREHGDTQRHLQDTADHLDQLAGQVETTAKSSIREIGSKYAPGAKIADSPSVLRIEEETGLKLAGIDIRGSTILEVPAQVRAVPKEVLDYARLEGVVIRTTEGVLL